MGLRSALQRWLNRQNRCDQSDDINMFDDFGEGIDSIETANPGGKEDTLQALDQIAKQQQGLSKSMTTTFPYVRIIVLRERLLLQFLAQAGELPRLVRRPGTKLHLLCQSLAEVDEFTFFQLREFILKHYADIVLQGDGNWKEAKDWENGNRGQLIKALCNHCAALAAYAVKTPGAITTSRPVPDDGATPPAIAPHAIEIKMSPLDGVVLPGSIIVDTIEDYVRHVTSPRSGTDIMLMSMTCYREVLQHDGQLIWKSSIPNPAQSAPRIEEDENEKEKKDDASTANTAEAPIANITITDVAPDPEETHEGRYRLYDQADLDHMIKQQELQPDDAKKMLKHNLIKLAELGAWRKFAFAPNLLAMEELKSRYPNFADVVDAVWRHLALSHFAKIPEAFTAPILLLGEPGIGKTAFAQALAKTFSTHFFEIRMNALSAGFALGGADLGWANGRPGLLFNEVALRELINPVGLLDEIDKVGENRQYDPLAHIYTLLERDTATRFKDEAIPIKLDLSHISWVATANDISGIDAALLTRFTVFEVPMPTPEQARTIAQNIYRTMLEQEVWGSHFAPTICDEVIDVVTAAPPREVRKLLQDALGNAASVGRNNLLASDFNDKRVQQTRKHSMGFN